MLTDLNFGDSELRSLGFDENRLTLKVLLPSEATFVQLMLTGVKNVWFVSNHMQNVLEAIYVFDNLIKARKHPEFEDFFQSFINNGEYDRHLKWLYIQPITGVDLAATFDEITYVQEFNRDNA